MSGLQPCAPHDAGAAFPLNDVDAGGGGSSLPASTPAPPFVVSPSADAAVGASIGAAATAPVVVVAAGAAWISSTARADSDLLQPKVVTPVESTASAAKIPSNDSDLPIS